MTRSGNCAAPIVLADVFYGHVRLETRMRPEGNKLIGEGRSRTYNGDGSLVKDTGWQPTGAVLSWE